MAAGYLGRLGGSGPGTRRIRIATALGGAAVAAVAVGLALPRIEPGAPPASTAVPADLAHWRASEADVGHWRLGTANGLGAPVLELAAPGSPAVRGELGDDFWAEYRRLARGAFG
jgi:hypothetical protein